MKKAIITMLVILFAANIVYAKDGGFSQMLDTPIEELMKMPDPKSDASIDAIISAATDPDKRNAKNRAWKMATGTVAWAFKVRTAVRWAYEEVKIWMGITNSFKELKKWFERLPTVFSDYGNSVHSFFTTSGGFVTKLEQLVGLYDDWDHKIATLPKQLDHRLAFIEYQYDKAVADQFTYRIGPYSCTLEKTPGVLVPNSAQIYAHLDEMIGSGIMLMMYDYNFNSININSPSDLNTIELGLNDDGLLEPDDYTGIIIANQLIASHVLSHSLEYRKWAQVAGHNLDSLDRAFKSAFESTTSINRKEMAAAWYAIENVNANNKRLRHSIEEAKVQQALIGTDLYQRSSLRALSMKQTLDFSL